jgi:hypothetical protein
VIRNIVDVISGHYYEFEVMEVDYSASLTTRDSYFRKCSNDTLRKPSPGLTPFQLTLHSDAPMECAVMCSIIITCVTFHILREHHVCSIVTVRKLCEATLARGSCYGDHIPEDGRRLYTRTPDSPVSYNIKSAKPLWIWPLYARHYVSLTITVHTFKPVTN